MRKLAQFSGWLFVAGAALMVFGGTNVIFSADTGAAAPPTGFKYIALIGLSFIIVALFLFGVINLLNKYEL